MLRKLHQQTGFVKVEVDCVNFVESWGEDPSSVSFTVILGDVGAFVQGYNGSTIICSSATHHSYNSINLTAEE